MDLRGSRSRIRSGSRRDAQMSAQRILELSTSSACRVRPDLLPNQWLAGLRALNMRQDSRVDLRQCFAGLRISDGSGLGLRPPRWEWPGPTEPWIGLGHAEAKPTNRRRMCKSEEVKQHRSTIVGSLRFDSNLLRSQPQPPERPPALALSEPFTRSPRRSFTGCLPGCQVPSTSTSTTSTSTLWQAMACANHMLRHETSLRCCAGIAFGCCSTGHGHVNFLQHHISHAAGLRIPCCCHRGVACSRGCGHIHDEHHNDKHAYPNSSNLSSADEVSGQI